MCVEVVFNWGSIKMKRNHLGHCHVNQWKNIQKEKNKEEGGKNKF